MQVLFDEQGRLIFQPDTEHDREELAGWWAQLQAPAVDGHPRPALSAATAERALVVFLPLR